MLRFNTNNLKDLDKELDGSKKVVNYDSDDEDFKVVIAIQQRTAKKYVTTVTDIPAKYDLPKLVKYIKKCYNCSGSVLKKEDSDEEYLKFSGDQRQNVATFFVECNVMDKENIIVRGF
jgi:translation initiation factor SUI1